MASDAVIVALEGEVECYRRLARLAEAQHEHVQQEHVEALLEVLGRRQEVLNQITTLEQVVAPAKRRWTEYVAGLEFSERSRAEKLMAETRRLLEQITTADRNDAMVLQQRKVNLGRQIGQASAARQVNRRYAAAAYGMRRSSMDVQQ